MPLDLAPKRHSQRRNRKTRKLIETIQHPHRVQKTKKRIYIHLEEDEAQNGEAFVESAHLEDDDDVQNCEALVEAAHLEEDEVRNCEASVQLAQEDETQSCKALAEPAHLEEDDVQNCKALAGPAHQKEIAQNHKAVEPAHPEVLVVQSREATEPARFEEFVVQNSETTEPLHLAEDRVHSRETVHLEEDYTEMLLREYEEIEESFDLEKRETTETGQKRNKSRYRRRKKMKQRINNENLALEISCKSLRRVREDQQRRKSRNGHLVGQPCQ
jgi:hypothetical protein